MTFPGIGLRKVLPFESTNVLNGSKIGTRLPFARRVSEKSPANCCAVGTLAVCDVADLLLVFGKWAGVKDARNAISALIVEKGTPGLTVLRKEDKLGHRASSTAALAFEEMRVPRENLLRGPGEGLKLLLAALNKSRPSVAAHALFDTTGWWVS